MEITAEQLFQLVGQEHAKVVLLEAENALLKQQLEALREANAVVQMPTRSSKGD